MAGRAGNVCRSFFLHLLNSVAFLTLGEEETHNATPSENRRAVVMSVESAVASDASIAHYGDEFGRVGQLQPPGTSGKKLLEIERSRAVSVALCLAPSPATLFNVSLQLNRDPTLSPYPHGCSPLEAMSSPITCTGTSTSSECSASSRSSKPSLHLTSPSSISKAGWASSRWLSERSVLESIYGDLRIQGQAGLTIFLSNVRFV